MKLFFRKFGAGQPVIILHGLMGCSDNWLSIAKLLGDKYEVLLPDLRNHGNSPHAPEIDYQILATDLQEFINFHSISCPVLAGHSMGGKVVMKYSRDHEESIKSIIIIDIAPKEYDPLEHGPKETANILRLMSRLAMVKVRSLKEAEDMLINELNDRNVINFILKNLKRGATNNYSWKINIDAITNNFTNFLQSPFEKEFHGKIMVPALFIKGANSKYILNDDFEFIEGFFPDSQVVTIPDSGHWLHIEQKELLINTIKLFLD